jgi:hypothetical protein
MTETTWKIATKSQNNVLKTDAAQSPQPIGRQCRDYDKQMERTTSLIPCNWNWLTTLIHHYGDGCGGGGGGNEFTSVYFFDLING